MKGKGLLIGGAVILLALAALAISLIRQPPEKSQPVQAQTETRSTAEITMAAKLQARTIVDIASPIEGKIETVHTEVGSEVYEGQLLAVVKSATLESARQQAQQDYERLQTRVNDLESALAAARLEASRAGADATRIRADLDRATRNLQREKMLLAEGATPRLTFEKAEKQFVALEMESKNMDQVAKQSDERVLSIQQELDTARKLLQDKTDALEASKERLAAGQVYSPVSGTMASMRARAGDDVHPSTKDLFQIATDLSTMEAVADVDSSQMSRIKPGQIAYIAVAESQDLLTGVVKEAVGGKVKVEFANPDPSIKPGLSAQIRIKIT